MHDAPPSGDSPSTAPGTASGRVHPLAPWGPWIAAALIAGATLWLARHPRAAVPPDGPGTAATAAADTPADAPGDADAPAEHGIEDPAAAVSPALLRAARALVGDRPCTALAYGPADETPPPAGLQDAPEVSATPAPVSTAPPRHYLRVEGGGWIYATLGLTPDVDGFNGPVHAVVWVDGAGRVVAYDLLPHAETPDYVSAMRAVLDPRLTGQPLHGPAPLPGVDAVTGATFTSEALLEVLRSSAPVFRARSGVTFQHPSEASNGAPGDAPGDAARAPSSTTDQETASQAGKAPHLPGGRILALLLLAAVVLRYRPTWTARIVLLITTVLFLGVALNAQFSSFHLLAWARGDLRAAAWGLPTLLLYGVPLVVLLAGNVYCGGVCPFGALQEVAGELWPRGWPSPDPTAWRRARYGKYAVAALLLPWAARWSATATPGGDLLLVVWSRGRAPYALGAALALVLLAIPFKRFWCRALCPTGAVLALLNRARLLWRIWPKGEPKVVPAWCDLGVQGARDADCIQCDRCWLRREAPRYRCLWMGRALLLLTLLGVVAILLATAAAFCPRPW